METNPQNSNPYPSIPPIIDSRDSEYQGSGITSTVAIAGHPIHPIIVIFPIGFLSGLAGSDIGYFLTQDPFWARASIWLLGAGLLSGVAAALIGMLDFTRIKRSRDRRAGWAHMYANVTALVLTIINFGGRIVGDSVDFILPWGLILSLVVSILLVVGGWYGGELMFRHKVGIVGASSRD